MISVVAVFAHNAAVVVAPAPPTKMNEDTWKYAAFISYSSRDASSACWLHAKLESYRIGKRFVGRSTAFGRIPNRLAPIFLDAAELGASSNLSEAVAIALSTSRCLVVICSPNAANSKWVDAEIRMMQREGRGNRVLALIIDGVPNSAEEHRECFPPAFRGSPDAASGLSQVEPSAADVRDGKDRGDALLRLIAGILDVPYGELRDRERQRRIRRVALWVIVLAVAIGVALNRYQSELDIRLERTRNHDSSLLGFALRMLDSDRMSATAALREISATPPRGTSTAAASLRRAAVPLAKFEHARAVYSAAFSADGTRVLTRSDDGARVWNADGSGAAILLKARDESAIAAVAFSRDGKKVVTGDLDGALRIWNADGSGAPLVLKGPISAVRSVVFSWDGAKVVAGGSDGMARVWNADGSGQPIVLSGQQNSVVAEISRDGKRIVLAGGDPAARVWNADGSGEPVVLRANGDIVQSAAFSPDGEKVVT